jgi:hypothetical protein
MQLNDAFGHGEAQPNALVPACQMIFYLIERLKDTLKLTRGDATPVSATETAPCRYAVGWRPRYSLRRG